MTQTTTPSGPALDEAGSPAPAPGSDVSSAIGRAVGASRAAFDDGRTRPLSWRRDQLRALVRMLESSKERIQAAVTADLGKSSTDAFLTEIGAVIGEAKEADKNLERWTADRSVGGALATVGLSRAVIRREPLGSVLIIGPWNYPLHLVLVPLVGAIAAGNTAVLKPSEVTPACSEVLADIVPRFLDAEAFPVVEGGVAETTELLDHAFDHIFYTGNGAVGSIVMAAAARHLTPVTLELGGKSPVWIDESFPLEEAARSIAWGKFSNAGQTCVAPDHVLTTPELAPRLADAVADAVRGYYGDDPRRSPDYGRIVNERHTERLAALIDPDRVHTGGEVDVAARYIAPTVLLDVANDAPAMQDEIFGPILPIVAVADHHEAIRVIRARPKPLAMYVFSREARVRDDILERTSSGGILFGEVMLHLGVSTLPFGGVGASGMGAYHGEHSIRTFSHERSVLRRLGGPLPAALARPPFTWWKRLLLG